MLYQTFISLALVSLSIALPTLDLDQSPSASLNTPEETQDTLSTPYPLTRKQTSHTFVKRDCPYLENCNVCMFDPAQDRYICLGNSPVVNGFENPVITEEEMEDEIE